MNKKIIIEDREPGELSEVTSVVRKYRSLVIFTNQRTGSSRLHEWFWQEHKKYTDYDGLNQAVTNLGYVVREGGFSDEVTHQHEIIDEWNGIYGHPIQVYQKEKQKNPKKALAKVEIFIKTLMAYRPTFKVMTEYTPVEICKLIIKYLNYYHYSTLLLYRRKSLDRCKSLHFSLSTKIYSPLDDPNEAAKVKKLNKNKFNLDLNTKQINNLIDNQKLVNKNNAEVWATLRTAGCRYASVSYEDLFGSLNNNTILHMTFRWLFYNVWDFEPLKEKGKMKADKYYNVKGIDKLKLKLDKLDNPTFSNLHVKV